MLAKVAALLVVGTGYGVVSLLGSVSVGALALWAAVLSGIGILLTVRRDVS